MTESLLTQPTQVSDATSTPQSPASPSNGTTPSSATTAASVETPWQKFLGLVEDEGLRTSKSLSKFQRPDDLIKSYTQLEQTLGADKNALLKMPNAPYAEAPDAWNELYDKLGRPKSAAEYGLKAPDGMTVDAGALEQFQTLAHQSGMTKAQVQAATDWYFQNTQKSLETQKQANQANLEAAQTQLKTEFGEAYDQKLQDAKKAIVHLGGEEFLQQANQNGLGANAAFIKAMAKAGAILREDGMIKDNTASENRNLSPAEARQQFNTYAADKSFQSILYDKSHPQQQWAKGEIARLVKFGAMG